MPVAQGSSRVRSTAVRLKKETPVCLCSCTPSEGIHAQVTSQRGSGAPGKTGSFTLVEVPVGTLHTGGGNLIPGVLHTGEGDRSFSGNPSKKTFFTSKKNFPQKSKKNFLANQKNFFCIKKNFLYQFTGKPRGIRRFRTHQKKLSVLVVVVVVVVVGAPPLPTTPPHILL